MRKTYNNERLATVASQKAIYFYKWCKWTYW